MQAKVHHFFVRMAPANNSLHSHAERFFAFDFYVLLDGGRHCRTEAIDVKTLAQMAQAWSELRVVHPHALKVSIPLQPPPVVRRATSSSAVP